MTKTALISLIFLSACAVDTGAAPEDVAGIYTGTLVAGTSSSQATIPVTANGPVGVNLDFGDCVVQTLITQDCGFDLCATVQPHPACGPYDVTGGQVSFDGRRMHLTFNANVHLADGSVVPVAATFDGDR